MRAWPDTTLLLRLAQPLPLATGLSRELFEPWRGFFRAERPGLGVSTMRIEPAIPWTFPRAAPRDRALRWFAAAATLIVATAAVLGAAMTAVMLGIT
jgi:hypothetical protein